MSLYRGYFAFVGIDPQGTDWQYWVENSQGIYIHTYTDPGWFTPPKHVSTVFIPWREAQGQTKADKRLWLELGHWRQFVMKECAQAIANGIDSTIRTAGVIILVVTPADEGILVLLAVRRGFQLIKVGRGWRVFRRGKELSDESARTLLESLAREADTPRPIRVTNNKHHPNSKSPEPSNVDDLYNDSVCAENGTRWAIDENGDLHRFCKPSNGEVHWNGSTAGKDPICSNDVPKEIKRCFQKSKF